MFENKINSISQIILHKIQAIWKENFENHTHHCKSCTHIFYFNACCKLIKIQFIKI